MTEQKGPRFFSAAWYVDLAPRWGDAKDLLRAWHAAAMAADVMRQADAIEAVEGWLAPEPMTTDEEKESEQ